jgi:uncharacterized protein DUF6572
LRSKAAMMAVTVEPGHRPSRPATNWRRLGARWLQGPVSSSYDKDSVLDGGFDMTVDQMDVIDLAAFNPTTNTVMLMITDHLEWTPDFEIEHIRMLQAKIYRYLDTIESGEIYESYPNSRGRKIMISVSMMFPMSDEGKRFSQWITLRIREAGHEIEFKQLP